MQAVRNKLVLQCNCTLTHSKEYKCNSSESFRLFVFATCNNYSQWQQVNQICGLRCCSYKSEFYKIRCTYENVSSDSHYLREIFTDIKYMLSTLGTLCQNIPSLLVGIKNSGFFKFYFQLGVTNSVIYLKPESCPFLGSYIRTYMIVI
jgi:hypothetical protein